MTAAVRISTAVSGNPRQDSIYKSLLPDGQPPVKYPTNENPETALTFPPSSGFPVAEDGLVS